MSLSRSTRNLAIGLSVVALFSLAGCNSGNVQAQGQGDGASLSGPPVINARYLAREPRKCNGVMNPPSASQAAAVAQCTMEVMSNTYLSLFENVTVQMGGSRPFMMGPDSTLEDIDTTTKVYSIRGSETMYGCAPVDDYAMKNRGKNCQATDMPQATGRCWRTNFGDWKCNLGGPSPNPPRYNVAPPTTY